MPKPYPLEKKLAKTKTSKRKKIKKLGDTLMMRGILSPGRNLSQEITNQVMF